MPRLKFRNFDRGLWVTGPRELSPADALRRARGIGSIKRKAIRSRNGSTLLRPGNAHSLYRFEDVRFYGIGISLFRELAAIVNDFDGTRLTFVQMPPQVGLRDSLFVAGGGKLVKIDELGAVTKWGIDAPPDGFTLAMLPQNVKEIDDCESLAGWSLFANAANLSLDAVSFTEGANSIRFTVPGGKWGGIVKLFPGIDLTQFAGAIPSAQEDFISFWMRLDVSTAMDFFQVLFTDTAGNIIIGYQASPTMVQGQWQQFKIRKTQFAQIRDFSFAQGIQILISLHQGAPNIPATGVNIDDIRMFGGVGLEGRYKYQVTFENSVTGSRSNPNPTPVYLPLGTTETLVERQGIHLANLPVATDPQVDKINIWRSLGNQANLFLIDTIPNGTITYDDVVADSSALNSLPTGVTFPQSSALLLDNQPPAGTYDDVAGPIGGRLFWTRDSAVGASGRIYFSPPGRPESVEDFVDVTFEDNPAPKVIVWNGYVWVFTEDGLYQGVEDVANNTFLFTRVFGVPGCNKPFTVKGTPFGILYRAEDGVRLFNGVQSRLVAFDAVAAIFRGEAAENLLPFPVGIDIEDTGEYYRNEYYISCFDVLQTLVLNLFDETWRDLGLPTHALYHEIDTDRFHAVVAGNVLTLDEPSVSNDDGVPIPFEVETVGALTDAAIEGLIQFVYIDVNTNGQLLHPTLILDNAVITLPTFQTPSRQIVEIPVGLTGRVLGVRVTGSLLSPVEIEGIEVDVYVPDSVQANV